MSQSSSPAPAFAKQPSISLKRVFVGGVATVIVCVVLLLLLSMQMRSFLMYRVAPEAARNHNFIRLHHEAHGEVLLLGTTHMRHFTSTDFGLQHLEAILENTKPSQAFVEMQQEEVERGFYGDGPVEMPFIALRSIELGIAVKGFDWWMEKKSDANRTGKKRGEHMFDRLRLTLPKEGRSLVFLGYAQVADLKKRLLGIGFVEKTFTDDEKNTFFAFESHALVFPHGMKEVVRERVVLLKKRAEATQSLKWRNDLQRVIDRRTELLNYIDLKGERMKPAGEAPPALKAEPPAEAPATAPSDDDGGTNKQAANDGGTNKQAANDGGTDKQIPSSDEKAKP
ncbi:MAG: hypothetical protein GY822_00330 [Deltaproteobacteria bacterium]|nr:hypothetical protein [Deltaproteobacteria bacterium]